MTSRQLKSFIGYTGYLEAYAPERAVRTIKELLPRIIENVEMTERVNDYLVRVVVEIIGDMRADKQYAHADRLRAMLNHVGVIVEITQDGITWRTK
ncbi:MAG: hypothetical protein WCB36_06830 [Burkholderiales bacterium]